MPRALKETPTVTPSGAVVGRPRLEPGPDAAEHITTLAAEGHSIVGIGSHLGVSREVFTRWLKERPDLQEAFERGREKERHTLHNVLYTAATSGNIVAAMFLLKARHGYREGDQAENNNRPAVVINLPGAAPLSAFTIDHERHPATQRLPDPAADPARRD